MWYKFWTFLYDFSLFSPQSFSSRCSHFLLLLFYYYFLCEQIKKMVVQPRLKLVVFQFYKSKSFNNSIMQLQCTCQIKMRCSEMKVIITLNCQCSHSHDRPPYFLVEIQVHPRQPHIHFHGADSMGSLVRVTRFSASPTEIIGN